MQRPVAFRLPAQGYRLAVPSRRRTGLREVADYLGGEARYRLAIHASILGLMLAAALAVVLRPW